MSISRQAATAASFVVVLALLVSLAPPSVAGAVNGGRSDTDRHAAGETAEEGGFDAAATAARADGAVRVIVELATAFVPEGNLSRGQAAAQRAAIAAERSGVHDDLQGTDYQEVREFETVPYVAMMVSEKAVERLRDSEHVATVVLDEAVPPVLAQSVPLVQGDPMHTEGFTGEGLMVAILDTGAEAAHPFLGGRVTEEACYSSNFGGSTTLCPDGTQVQVGPGSGDDCDLSITGCGHGTHVAGIAAGSGGVAPGAEIMSVQVFSRFNDPADCSPEPAPCALTWNSDQMAALERVYLLHTAGTHTFASANMSLGHGEHSSACDADARKPIIDNLRSVQVATVVASGNNGFLNAVGAPACISTAVSVGSTTKTDQVSGFSNNHATLVDLLAPGSSINSSVPGGGMASFNGTSMAAPHVAGAWALLRQHADAVAAGAASPVGPAASVSSILDALQSTGLLVPDNRLGGIAIRPRIRIFDAAGFEAQPQTELNEGFDVVPPSGWAATNLSEPLGTTGWMQGNPGTFPAHAGPTNSYAAANFNSTSGTGTISNWLVSPLLVISPASTLTFFTRSVMSAHPDRLEVRASTNGSCAVSGTSSDVGPFTTLLLTINPTLEAGGYPTAWTQYDVDFGAIPTESIGCVAFRYHVTDGGPAGSNSDYIGIDTLTYTAPAAATGSLGGTVTAAATGAPVSGAAVQITGPTSSTTTTASDGSFLATGLTPGSYTVTVSAAGFPPSSQTAAVVAGELTTMSFTLASTPGVIDLLAMDGVTGFPIADAIVDLTGPQTVSEVTGPDGVVLIDNLTPGTYAVTVSATGYVPASGDVEVSAGVTIEVDAALARLPPEVASTGDEATAEEPLVVTVLSPFGGPIMGGLEEATGTAPAGWVFADSQFEFTAPAATVGNPIVIELRLHRSQLAVGQNADHVEVMRDSDLVADCDGPEGVADPDPCVAARVTSGGEVVITVLTSQGSIWRLLWPEGFCPPGLPLPFGDVDAASVHAASIACVVHREVAGGFADGTYRPGQDVRRGQMASFVAQALEAAGFVLPPATNQGFTDIAGNVHADAINRLVAAGIVGGTSATTFTPGAPVRRAQMASFLVGAVEWAFDVDLEPDSGPHFTDTAGVHATNIDIAFELGLTTGAGPGIFNPGATTRRAPMASFLVNLLDVIWPVPDPTTATASAHGLTPS